MYRVVIIEDEHIIRKGLIYGFDYAAANCIVVGEAGNGKEGAKLIKETNPDIVITDINMPISDGFEMLEETIDYSYSTIIVSGYDEFANARKAIKYGVTEFLVKPIDTTELQEALERAIYQFEILKNFQKKQEEKKALHQIQLLETGEEEMDEAVLAMIQYIENNYSEKFLFQDVVKTVGYSATSLHQRFKKQTNYTFIEYLTRFRIQRSVELIQQGDKHLYEIAEKTGFSDYKYFNKVFRKYIGMNATQFQEALQKIVES